MRDEGDTSKTDFREPSMREPMHWSSGLHKAAAQENLVAAHRNTTRPGK